MNPFWLLVGAMLVVAVATAVVPLLRRAKVRGPRADDLNLTIHRQRLKELEADRDSGLMSADEFAGAYQELGQQLIQEVSTVDAAPEPAIDGGRAPWTGVVLAVAIPAVALGLYWQLGAWQQPATSDANPAATADPAPSAGQPTLSLEAALEKLERRLQVEPDNIQGWAMLARSYSYLNRYEEASEAYARAVSLTDTPPPALLLDYAEALALTNEGRLAGQPAELVSRAIARAPDDPKALWLAGMAGFQDRDYAVAVNHWRRLQAVIPQDSEHAGLLARFLAEAVEKSPQIEGAGQPEPEPPVAPAAPAGLTVSVSLDSSLAAKAAPDDTVFLFARAQKGPRMPLAIVRKKVRDLPFTATLDDSQAMMPAMKLSNFPEVVVGARISKSGRPIASSGDLQGLSGTIKTGVDKALTVVIDQTVP